MRGAARELVREEERDAAAGKQGADYLLHAQALSAERRQDGEGEKRAAHEHERRGERGRQVHAAHHRRDVHGVPDKRAEDEARQVLAPGQGAAELAAKYDGEQGNGEQRQRGETDEEERTDADLVEHMLDEREVEAPDDHGRDGGEEGPAIACHAAAEFRIDPPMQFETPLAARAAVRSLIASKIRELYNEGIGRTDILPFWVGEPEEPTPDFIRRAGIASIEAGEVFYSHNYGIPELRD